MLLWEIVTFGESPLCEKELDEIIHELQNGTLQHPRCVIYM